VIALPRDVSNLEQVLEMTKAGLKSSKRSGKNIVSICRDGKAQLQNARFDSYDLLSRKEDFAAESQPIFSFVDGIAVAYELYSRRPGQELSMPGEFIPVARDRGMATEVDLYCLQACLDEAEKLPPVPVVHINLLPSTLSEVPAEQIIEMTAKLRSSRHLCLEFSEKNLMTDPSYLFPKVRQLKEAGILIGLDDVGFGCSSLETLALFDPDCIKIDSNVTKGIAQDPWKQMTVSKIVSIAESLNTVPIAEGIESGADLATIHRLGVLHGQGWYWRVADAEAPAA
jgi:FOG: EAL domain